MSVYEFPPSMPEWIQPELPFIPEEGEEEDE